MTTEIDTGDWRRGKRDGEPDVKTYSAEKIDALLDEIDNLRDKLATAENRIDELEAEAAESPDA